MQFDIKTAFLYGDLEEDIFMFLPDGIKDKYSSNSVCKLRKSLYGLKQAPRCWNKTFNNFLCSFGFKQCESDRCVYQGQVNNEKVFLALYVDDGLIISKKISSIETVLNKLKDQFEITFNEAN